MNALAVEIAAREGAADRLDADVRLPRGDGRPHGAEAGRQRASVGEAPARAAGARFASSLSTSPTTPGRCCPRRAIVLRVVARHELVLATAHLARDDTFAVVDAAFEAGVAHRRRHASGVHVPALLGRGPGRARGARLPDRALPDHAASGKTTFEHVFDGVRAVGLERNFFSSDSAIPHYPPVEDGLASAWPPPTPGASARTTPARRSSPGRVESRENDARMTQQLGRCRTHRAQRQAQHHRAQPRNPRLRLRPARRKKRVTGKPGVPRGRRDYLRIPPADRGPRRSRARCAAYRHRCPLERRVAAVEATRLGVGWIDGDVGHGPAYRFTDPDGHVFELFYEVERYSPPPRPRARAEEPAPALRRARRRHQAPGPHQRPRRRRAGQSGLSPRSSSATACTSASSSTTAPSRGVAQREHRRAAS